MIFGIVWLGLVLLSPTIEIGGLVAVGTPFLLTGACCHCLQFFRRDFRTSLGPSGVLGLMYLACILMSLVWSPNFEASAVRAGYQVIGFILFLNILEQQNLQNDFKRFRFWVIGLACAGFGISIHFLSLMGLLFRQGRLQEAFGERFTGGLMSLTWGASNVISASILPALFAALLLRRGRRWFGRAAVACMLLAILATLSRNAMLCIVASVVVYACLSRRGVSTIGVIILLGLVLSVGLVMVDEETYAFVITSRIESTDMEFNGRTEIWQDTWRTICESWPVPIGYYGSQSTMRHSPHNLILVDWLEIGMWGLAIHLAFLASVAKGLWTARSSRHRAGKSSNDLNVLLAGLFCICLNLQFEDAQYTQPLIICSWVFMGICVAAARLPMDLASYAASTTCHLNRS